MKQLIPTALLFGALSATDATAGQIDLKMSGFASDDGMARIVVMEGRDGYSGATPVALVASVPIRDGEAAWSGEVPPGTYAIIAHHDRNGNGALDRPLFQLPLEPYGYSNGAWTSAGLPSFEEVAFEVGEGASPQRIVMRSNAFITLAKIIATAAVALTGLLLLVSFRRRAMWAA